MFRILILCLFFWSSSSIAQPKPAKEVFIPSIEQSQTEQGYQTTISIDFPNNYFLYADKTTLNGEQLYQATPKPVEKHDMYLGLTQVWSKPVRLVVQHTEPTKRFVLKTQGCEENVICYPPMSFELEVPETSVPSETVENIVPAKKKSPFLANKATGFLSPEEAFAIDQHETDEQLTVTIQMPDESYYLYRSSIGVLLEPKRFVPELSDGEQHHDPFLGQQEIYRGQLQISLPKSHLSADGEAWLEFQGCAEGRVCYPKTRQWLSYQPSPNATPAAEQTSTEVATPAAKALLPSDEPSSDASLSDRAINQLHQHYLASLPLIFLLGVGMAFTACVYPLIPIVSSVVVGEHISSARAYRLIGVYVLGMGSALAILGALFAMFELNLQLLLQKPWVVLLVAGLFGLLALSMFGAFTLRLPSSLQTRIDRLSRQQRSGSYLGVYVMGALSVLMVSACSTPVLTALLMYASQTNPPQGALALFVYGIGQGAPLFLFASTLKRFMPKSGLWMGHVKTAFAFMLLAIAVWLLARISSAGVQSALWGMFGLLLTVYLLPKNLPQNAKDKALWFACLLSFALSFGQLQQVFAPRGVASQGASQNSVQFQMINNIDELQSALAASDKPVLLDFFAQWCVSCYQWEEQIWHNPELKEVLSSYTLLKVDLTDTTPAHHELLKALSLVGPPAVLAYPPHATSLSPNAQWIGESSLADFRKNLASLR